MENLNEPAIKYAEPNPLKKNLAGIIDGIIIIALYMGIATILPQRILTRIDPTIIPILFMVLLFAMYRLVYLFIAGGTIGMRICKIELLNDDMEELSTKEKISAAFFMLINGVRYYNRAT